MTNCCSSFFVHELRENGLREQKLPLSQFWAYCGDEVCRGCLKALVGADLKAPIHAFVVFPNAHKIVTNSIYIAT